MTVQTFDSDADEESRDPARVSFFHRQGLHSWLIAAFAKDTEEYNDVFELPAETL